jgi:hypothetical protein
LGVERHALGENMIRKEGRKWVLRSRDSKRVLGRYKTRAEAEAAERRAVRFRK